MANRPIKKFRSGNIESAIWLNTKTVDGNSVDFKTVSLSKSWKKQDEDIWRSEVINLRRNDIAKAMLVLQKAQEELFLAEEVQESGENEKEE